MAFVAGDGGVLPEQWIRALGVRRHSIGGGRPAVGGMAAGAVAGVGVCGELSPMNVLVAGLTLHMRHRGLEVGGLVTLVAGHRRMFAEQREPGLRVVERRDGISRRLPGGIVMARITGGGKRTAMGVFMAVGALRPGVGAGEFVSGGGMVEARDVFPFGCGIGDRVAALAFVAQLAFVPVFVAGRACGAQPEVSAAQILHEDALAGGGGNPVGIVTAVALQTGMAAFERIACLTMIEILQADIPADGDELLAVVLGVALAALVVAPRLSHQGRVQPLVHGEPLFDLGVTAGALQLVLAAAADVTAGAVCRPVEFGVGFG